MRKIFLLLSITSLFIGCSREEEDPNKELEKTWDNLLGTWVLKETITYAGESIPPTQRCAGKEFTITFLKEGQAMKNNYFNENCEAIEYLHTPVFIAKDGRMDDNSHGILYNHAVISLTRNKIITKSYSNSEYHPSMMHNYDKLIFERRQ